MVVAFKSFAFERISTEKLKATGCHLCVFLSQYTISTFRSSFRNAMQMEMEIILVKFIFIIVYMNNC